MVSDHGFARTENQLNLFPAFRDAKLFTVDAKGKIADWKAMPWVTGGSAAIVLKDPNDTADVTQVSELLANIAGDPANGVDRVLEADDLHQRGGYPPASFFVSLKPGWRTGSSRTDPLVMKVKLGGPTGNCRMCRSCGLRFSWSARESRLEGPGVIDMRDIAPTLVHAAGLALPTADGKNMLP